MWVDTAMGRGYNLFDFLNAHMSVLRKNIIFSSSKINIVVISDKSTTQHVFATIMSLTACTVINAIDIIEHVRWRRKNLQNETKHL